MKYEFSDEIKRELRKKRRDEIHALAMSAIKATFAIVAIIIALGGLLSISLAFAVCTMKF